MKNNYLTRRQLGFGVELYHGWIVPACDRSQVDPGQNSLRELERTNGAGQVVNWHHRPENRGELQHACLGELVARHRNFGSPKIGLAGGHHIDAVI
jgi:hypothetical protein